MTVLEVLNAATGFLEKHAVENPRLNAQHLLARVLDCRRLDLYLAFDRPLSEPERARLRDLVRLRADGKPLQHLLGEWDFFSRKFSVDPRALIPRPETELLVERALAVLPHDHPLTIHDLGTGSGILAITLALECPAWHLSASDISEDALDLARQNATALHAPVAFSHANLLPAGPPLDAIIANLPYIPTADIQALAREVRHDPLPSLDGGPDGLSVLRKVIEAAPSRLLPGGWIFLEFGIGQENVIADLLAAAGFSNPLISRDLAGLPRVIEARLNTPPQLPPAP